MGSEVQSGKHALAVFSVTQIMAATSSLSCLGSTKIMVFTMDSPMAVETGGKTLASAAPSSPLGFNGTTSVYPTQLRAGVQCSSAKEPAMLPEAWPGSKPGAP